MGEEFDETPESKNATWPLPKPQIQPLAQTQIQNFKPSTQTPQFSLSLAGDGLLGGGGLVPRPLIKPSFLFLFPHPQSFTPNPLSRSTSSSDVAFD